MLEDWQLLEKLRNCKDQVITSFLEELRIGVTVIEDAQDYEFHRQTKVRLIDPDVPVDGEIHRASMLSNTIQLLNEEAFQKASKGVYVKVL